MFILCITVSLLVVVSWLAFHVAGVAPVVAIRAPQQKRWPPLSQLAQQVVPQQRPQSRRARPARQAKPARPARRLAHQLVNTETAAPTGQWTRDPHGLGP